MPPVPPRPALPPRPPEPPPPLPPTPPDPPPPAPAALAGWPLPLSPQLQPAADMSRQNARSIRRGMESPLERTDGSLTDGCRRAYRARPVGEQDPMCAAWTWGG